MCLDDGVPGTTWVAIGLWYSTVVCGFKSVAFGITSRHAATACAGQTTRTVLLEVYGKGFSVSIMGWDARGLVGLLLPCMYGHQPEMPKPSIKRVFDLVSR